MFQILPCPTCQRSLILQSGVSQQATLKCPSCQSQFVLHDILTSYFAQWETVEDPEPQQVPFGVSAGQHTVDVPSSDDGIELELQAVADNETQTAHLASKINEQRLGGAEKQKVDWSRFKPITHEEYQRMRRKATSPGWTFVQIVLGGLAAIPVALLLIWHVVGTDIGGAAPAIAQYLPWIVPERFRPLARSNEYSAEEFVLPDSETDGFRKLEEINDAVAPTAVDEKTELSSKPAVESLEIVDSSADNVFASIRTCEGSLQAWIDGRDGDKSQRQELAQGFFGDLLLLATELSRLAPDHPTGRTVRLSVDRLARTISEQPDVKALILAGAKAKLRDESNADSLGFAVVMKVAKVEETDKQWSLVPEQNSIEELQLPMIVIPRQLAPGIMVGDELFILGNYDHTAVESAPKVTRIQAAYACAFHAN